MGGKPRPKKKPTGKLLHLLARPRVAPLWWPHTATRHVQGTEVAFAWVTVKPDGGWTTSADPDRNFRESDLEDVLERFYESAGPWPFDFRVFVVVA